MIKLLLRDDYLLSITNTVSFTSLFVNRYLNYDVFVLFIILLSMLGCREI